MGSQKRLLGVKGVVLVMKLKNSLMFACAGLLVFVSSLSADTVTLPVAASVVGLAPFFSDVRVFNTSYTDVLNVTATYRFGAQPVRTFTLAPREAKAFDDICVSLFGVPNSLGAVEFVSSGGVGQLVVTSRLYSPAGVPPWPSGTVGSVGMFIPGLPSSAAKAVTVLTGLSNAGSGTGSFRTNVGVYNPNGVSVGVTIRLYNWQGSFPPVLLGVLSPATVPGLALGPRSGVQLSNVYAMVGFGNLVTTNGYATVESDSVSSPLFTYAATADNTTQDPVLVVGAEDVAAPPGFNPPTPTRTPGGATATPTPPGPTATPTPTPTSSSATVVNLVATCWVWSFNGGPSSFTMRVGQTYQLRISNGDSGSQAGCRPHGFGGVPGLGIPRQSPLNVGSPPAIVMFTPAANQTGTFPFACDQSGCGVGHSNMLGSITVAP